MLSNMVLIGFTMVVAPALVASPVEAQSRHLGLSDGATIEVESSPVDGDTIASVATVYEDGAIVQKIEIELSHQQYVFAVRSPALSGIYTELSITPIQDTRSFLIDASAYVPPYGWRFNTFELIPRTVSLNCALDESAWSLKRLNIASFGEPDLEQRLDNMNVTKAGPESDEFNERLLEHFRLAENVLGRSDVIGSIPSPFRSSMFSTGVTMETGVAGSTMSECEVTESTITAAGCTGSCLLFAACLYAGCGGMVGCGGCAAAGGVCAACISSAMSCGGDDEGGSGEGVTG